MSVDRNFFSTFAKKQKKIKINFTKIGLHVFLKSSVKRYALNET